MHTVGDHHEPDYLYIPLGLQEVREKRLRQLHQEKVLREAVAMCGTGTLQDVPEQELLVSTWNLHVECKCECGACISGYSHVMKVPEMPVDLKDVYHIEWHLIPTE